MGALNYDKKVIFKRSLVHTLTQGKGLLHNRILMARGNPPGLTTEAGNASRLT